MIEVKVADITALNVDAIFNSANKSLLAGGGVCGAIHRAAGKELEAECLRLYNGCGAGDAVVTAGFNLPAKYVIHAVGPNYRKYDSADQAAQTLAATYRRSIEEASKLGIESITFPSISTGIYGFPIRDAAAIAAKAINDALRTCPKLKQVIMCCFSEPDALAYSEAFKKYEAQA